MSKTTKKEKELLFQLKQLGISEINTILNNTIINGSIQNIKGPEGPMEKVINLTNRDLGNLAFDVFKSGQIDENIIYVWKKDNKTIIGTAKGPKFEIYKPNDEKYQLDSHTNKDQIQRMYNGLILGKIDLSVNHPIYSFKAYYFGSVDGILKQKDLRVAYQSQSQTIFDQITK